MSTSEQVLEFLKMQGFLPEVDSDGGNIYFKYQMRNFIFVNNDEDKEFFQLVLPNIYDVTEDNRELVLEAINTTNATMKVAKTCIIDTSVFVLFECLLDSTPNVADLIPRALGIIQASQQKFYESLN